MKKYIGTKMVMAKPMSRKEYNDYRGWQLPANENGDDQGFLVEYLDSPNGNDSRHAGYISWSPADVFARAYKATDDIPARLTLSDITDKIKKADYYRLGNSTTTVCQLTLANGFTVQGYSACIDPSQFNQAIGESIAYENAVQEVWALEGYLLSERRHQAGI